MIVICDRTQRGKQHPLAHAHARAARRTLLSVRNGRCVEAPRYALHGSHVLVQLHHEVHAEGDVPARMGTCICRMRTPRVERIFEHGDTHMPNGRYPHGPCMSAQARGDTHMTNGRAIREADIDARAYAYAEPARAYSATMIDTELSVMTSSSSSRRVPADCAHSFARCAFESVGRPP